MAPETPPQRKNVRSGVIKGSRKQNIEITYEESQPPENIGVTKSWNSWNSSKCSIILCCYTPLS